MPSSEPERRRPNSVQTGRSFEQQAAQFYLDQGFTVVAQNWQASHKEIDLIVRKDDLLVFVEVKASDTDQFGHPIQKMTKAKRRNLAAAASLYLATYHVQNCDVRFDVVTFYKGQLEQFPAAFTAEE
jgi:putative endonuclease